ncbi:MAG: exo-alpha-sialidase [candidate division NC10 bacterium]|nr:exo-alpha-sialidase [candidate division NC10 bacterium]MDE2321232.1 exo-alpha-sialidase [candidate division NC10 bacterium]
MRHRLLGLACILILIAGSGFTFQRPRPEDSSIQARDPVMAADPNGPLYLAWVETREKSQVLMFTRSTDEGKTWEPDRRLDLGVPEGAQASGPQLAADGKGHLLLVWRNRVKGELKAVLVVTSPDFGKSWSEPKPLNTGDGYQPQLRLDDKGQAVVVWYEHERGLSVRQIKGTRVLVVTSPDFGKSWSAPVALDDGSGMATMPQLATAGPGRLVVAWQEVKERRTPLFVATTADGGKNWQTTKLDRPGIVAGAPTLAADQKGHIMISWAETVELPDIFTVVSSDFGKSWSKEIRPRTTTPGETPAINPQLALSSTGKAALVWEDQRAGASDIYLTVSSDFGKSWSKEIRLDTGEPGGTPSRSPHLVLDPTGRIAAVWEEKAGGASRLQASVSPDFAKSWQPQPIPEPAAVSATRPHLLLAKGRTFLVTEISQPGKQRIVATLLAP